MFLHPLPNLNIYKHKKGTTSKLKSNNMKYIFPVIALFFPLLTFSQVSSTNSELKGVVKDSNNANVKGATVTILDLETQWQRTNNTNENGEFRFFALLPRSYQISIESKGFAKQIRKVEIGIGQSLQVDFVLQIESKTINVVVETPLDGIEIEKTQQSNTIKTKQIGNLPIDRRDYLTFALLVPGIVDSTSLADNTDFRIVQTPTSGLSFYGSNGRGNSISIDGLETNDLTGGVRATSGQESVKEFQINRSNYNAEFGGASGGVINIVTKSGTNSLSGNIFSYFRHSKLDAADPFAIVLNGNIPQRIKPPANRQQFGGTVGFPIIKNRTFFFGSFEGLRRRESSTVSVLTDVSIFQPTTAQQTIINTLAASSDATPINCLSGQTQVTAAVCAGILKSTLISKNDLQSLFRNNSGVFPFSTDGQNFSLRIDDIRQNSNIFVRYNLVKNTEDNQNTRALVGFSRSSNTDALDHTLAGGWTRIINSNVFNELLLQWNYRNYNVTPNDPNGPELNVPGFGFFNRDISLPSITKERRFDVADNFTFIRGNHNWKLGGKANFRFGSLDFKAFFSGRFGFSNLPGSIVSPQLASTTINALQSLDLGLPVTYQQAFGDSLVKGKIPFYAVYGQDTWNLQPNVTLNLGIRYELDKRLSPLPTYKKNIAPRFGLAWSPFANRKTVLRGGYGVFYAPIILIVDFIVKALNEIDGFRQAPQVLTVLNQTNPFVVNGPVNVFRTLRSQGIIGIPNTNRTITPSDLAQFGFVVSQTGTRNPFTALFRDDPTYRNPMAQQASFSIEHHFQNGLNASIGYIWSLTHHITRSRDINLLPRPISSRGIREWTAASGCTGAALASCFRDPTIFQEIIYESAASAAYNGMIVEVNKKFGDNFELSANYTLSKAFDMVTDYNSDFRAFDQTDQRAERSLSAFDQRHKFVLFASIKSKFSNVWLQNISLTPIFRANSGRPFNLLAGSDVNGDRSINGDRPIGAGRNTGIGPRFFTFDLRLSKSIKLSGEKRKLELTAEAFNLLNNLNFASINNTVGTTFAAPFNVKGRSDVGPSVPLGFSSAYDPRRIQIGVKFSF